MHYRVHRFFVWRRVLGFGIEVERVLVFVAVIAVKSQAQLRKGSLDEWRFQDDAGQSYVTRRLQIDLVKRRRQEVSAAAGTKLAKSFRIRDRKFLVCAKSLDGIANFLGLRHSHRSGANFRNHANDAIVTRST